MLLDSPDTGTTRYAYDSAGNRVSQRDAKGVEVNYTYDALNRLTDIDYADDTLDIGFTYDEGVNGIGRLTTMTEVRLSGVLHARYTYNGRGERVKKEAGGEGVYFHYDPNGMLLAETDAQGQTLKEYLYLERIPLAVTAAKATPSGVFTLEPQTHTLSLEGLSGWDGTYRIAPERWRETPKGLLAAHTTPSRVRLKAKLVLNTDSPSGTLTLTHPPRQAHYTLNETRGDGIYSGINDKTGKTVGLGDVNK